MAEKIGQGLNWLEALKLLGPNWGSTKHAGTSLTPAEMVAMEARNPGLVFVPEEATSVRDIVEQLALDALDQEEEAADARAAEAEKQGPALLQKIQGGKPKYDVFEGLKDIPDPYHFKVNEDQKSLWQTLKDKIANWYDNPNEPDLFTGLPEDNRDTFEHLTGVAPKYRDQFLKDFVSGAKHGLNDLKAGMLGVGAGTEAATNAFVNKIGQWASELWNRKAIKEQQEAEAQRMQDALAAFGPSAETSSSEKKGPKRTPGEKPKAEDESGYDWAALWTAIGSGIGNWAFDPRTGSLIRTDSNGPSIFEILKNREDIRASKQKSQQPIALGGSAYYDPRTGEVVQTESDVMKVAKLQMQMAQDEEKRKNAALAAQLLAELEPRERMKLMSEAMLAGKDKLDTNAYVIQRIQNANAKRK